jgi:hypothetical protein
VKVKKAVSARDRSNIQGGNSGPAGSKKREQPGILMRRGARQGRNATKAIMVL